MSWREWTGVGERRWKTAPNEHVQPPKTLWDWLQLLIVPAILVAVTFAWSAAQTKSDNRREDRRIAADRAAAEQVRQDTTLNGYFQQMSDLMLTKKLLSSNPGDPVGSVARTVTLTTLRRLDGERKGDIVRFLYEARLIGRSGVSLIELTGADLTHADLSGANLTHSDLGDADLTRADLRGANLTGAVLRGAVLRFAVLRFAELRGAVLRFADLGGANLTGAVLVAADLTGANLTHAVFSRADLGGAVLRGAVLRGANLTGAFLGSANLTEAFLRRADLRGANLGDANLTRADLRFADLTGAHLRGAKLAGAKGLPPRNR